MIGNELLFEITRLKSAGWSDRKIARHLGCDRTTVKKYVENPYRQFEKPPPRQSKLAAYRYLIHQWLKEDPEVKAPVVLQRLTERASPARSPLCGIFYGNFGAGRNTVRRISASSPGPENRCRSTGGILAR
jgi:hypothetical protein